MWPRRQPPKPSNGDRGHLEKKKDGVHDAEWLRRAYDKTKSSKILKRPRKSTDTDGLDTKRKLSSGPNVGISIGWSQPHKKVDTTKQQKTEATTEVIEKQEEAFDHVFDEVFGPSTANRQSIHTEEEDTGLPSAFIELKTPQAQPKAEEKQEIPSTSTSNHQDEWSFQSPDALELDVFDAPINTHSISSSLPTPDTNYKTEGKHQEVSNNFVRLNMRKRIKGRSGNPRKLPDYLRSRSNDTPLNDPQDPLETNTQPSTNRQAPPKPLHVEDRVDFIEECLDVLHKVEASSSTVVEKQGSKDPEPPKCHHGSTCERQEVKKKNKNHGRVFFSCPLGRFEGRCDFFLWEDDHTQAAFDSLLSSSTFDSFDCVPLDLELPISQQEDALLTNLRLVFGHKDFRPGQHWAISRVLEKKDTILVLATGAGKSLTYQLPSLFLPGLTVVISPLISLMNDQMSNLPPALRDRSAVLGRSSVDKTASKSETAQVIRDVVRGKLKLLFLSPEKALTRGVQQLLSRIRLSLVCVDEAHCVSEWSHHFRPSYLRLQSALFPMAERLLALTATASKRVVQDLLTHFRTCTSTDDSNKVLRLPWQRSNLQLQVLRVDSDEHKVQELCRLLSRSTGATIVYVHQQRHAEELAACLEQQLDVKGWKKAIGSYHAGMDAATKEKVRTKFLRGRLRVVVATIAFGMGIDKANVRTVVHYHLPFSVEHYVQQIGRAGRDGKDARAVLFLLASDVRVYRSLVFANSMDEMQLHKLLSLVFTCALESNVGCVVQNKRETYVTISQEQVMQRVDMKAASVETFLTLLSLKSWENGVQIKLLPASSTRCRIVMNENEQRKVACGQNVETAALISRMEEMIVSRQVQDATVDMHVEGYLRQRILDFHVGEMADAMKEWEDDAIDVKERRLLQRLRDCQFVGVVHRVDLSCLSFRLQVRYPEDVEPSSLVHSTAQWLYAKHKELEKLQVDRLEVLYSALDASSMACSSITDENERVLKAEELHTCLTAYFDDTEVVSKDARKEVMKSVLDPFTPDVLDAIQSDIQTVLTEEASEEWTAHGVAKIFHGLTSPQHPAKQWGSHRFWRKYANVAFEQVVQVADQVLRSKVE